jgi:hypothetical protein
MSQRVMSYPARGLEEILAYPKKRRRHSAEEVVTKIHCSDERGTKAANLSAGGTK